MRMLRSRACRKRPENADRQPAACIFGRARSIAIDSTISTGALLNLRETRHEFSHSLGREWEFVWGLQISASRRTVSGNRCTMRISNAA